MKSLLHYISNPVISSNVDSLEKEEMKEYNTINRLFRLNLKKIIKDRKNKEKQIIYCIQGKMYFIE